MKFTSYEVNRKRQADSWDERERPFCVTFLFPDRFMDESERNGIGIEEKEDRERGGGVREVVIEFWKERTYCGRESLSLSLY